MLGPHPIDYIGRLCVNQSLSSTWLSKGLLGRLLDTALMDHWNHLITSLPHLILDRLHSNFKIEQENYNYQNHLGRCYLNRVKNKIRVKAKTWRYSVDAARITAWKTFPLVISRSDFSDFFDWASRARSSQFDRARQENYEPGENCIAKCLDCIWA